VSYVLCTGNHPANYKGCTVYKQLQQKSFPTLRRREPNHPSTQPQAQIEENQTYAEAARKAMRNTQNRNTDNSDATNEKQTPPNKNEVISELKSMMKILTEQMGLILGLLTAFVTKSTK